MEGDDHKIAASLFPTTKTTTTTGVGGVAPPQQQQKKTSGKGVLYDATGKRLRGAAAAAAVLMHDQNRYATTPEEQQFFRDNVWGEAGSGGGERQSAGGSSSPSPSQAHGQPYSLGGNTPRRPDMFGNNAASSTPESALALEKAVMMWGEEDGADDGGRRAAVYGAVPALHQWSYVRAAEDDSKDPLFHPQGRWKRADELLEGEALLRGDEESRSSVSERKVYTRALNAYHLLAPCASGDSASASASAKNTIPTAGSPVLALGGVVRPGGKAHDAFSFFTFTDEEYAGLAPSPAATAATTTPDKGAAYCFDLSSTRKLFTLYERYGSFIVVADRWSLAPSATGPAGTAPSVEDLCAEYQRVTQGVLMQRVRRLQQALLPFYHHPSKEDETATHANRAGGKGKGTEHDNNNNNNNNKEEAGSTHEGVAAAFHRVNRHPLLTLALKHPFLQHCEKELLLTPPPSPPSPPPPASFADTSVPQGVLGVAPVVVVEDNHPPPPEQTPAKLFKDLTTPSSLCESSEAAAAGRLWYDAAGERRRRRGLAQLLDKESKVNVPYQRAAAAYLAVVPKAAHALQRLQNLVQVSQASEDERAVAALARRDESSLSPLSRLSSLFELFGDDPSLFEVELRALPDVDPVAWQAAEAALQAHGPSPHPPDESATEKKTRVSRKPAAAAAAAVMAANAASAESTTTTLASMIFEVFHQIPVTCARLPLAAQAGWLLPPPEPLPQRSSSSSAPKGRGGHHTSRTAGDGDGDGGGGASSQHRKRQREESADSSEGGEDEGRGGGGGKEENAGQASPSSHRGRPGLTSPEQQQRLLAEVVAAGVCNRCYSGLSEGVLVTLPRVAPRLHKEVEEDLEKYLWDDSAALMENSPLVVAHLVPAIRLAYTQNIVLKRFLGRVEYLLEAMQKVEAAAAVEAPPDGGEPSELKREKD